MAKITIGFGLVLIALGLGGYFGTGRESWTALIPAFLGLPLLILGLVACNERRRKTAIHIAVGLGLLGFAATVSRLIPVLLTGGELERPTAVAVQAAMAIVCLVFVVLCVWSFIKARRAGAAQRDS